MNLKNKTLLLMGGGAYAKGIKKYKDEKGFHIVAVGKDSNTPISKIADVFYNVDTQNVDEIVEIVKKEGIDGIFVGSSEVNIAPAITVSERTGCNFYANREQWDIISDKAEFKKFARKYGVPVPCDFYVTEEFKREDIDKIKYPVIVKPVDSSGARGMNVCNNEEDLEKYYLEALKWSKKKEVIIEELITDADEVFFQYTLQDGEVSLTSCFTKVFVDTENKNLILPIFHMYPSKYIDLYYDMVHEGVKKLFQAMGINNGVMTLQSFYKNDRFYIFEAGFRMGGAQNYILTEYQWGINSLNCMINYALTGSMNDAPIIEADNARFRHPCCNYYVGLKAGIIAKMGGVEQVKAMPGVLNVTVMSHEGEEILETNALERICLRIHVVGETPEKLAKTLVEISNTLEILSTDGDEMQLEYLNYERCLSAIHNTTIF
ncbi:MAG: ATP-grasp domain-containing protein [Clostridia bacterium]|nr:ATP-grasp domain-containing protein [Clostridia bacterium]